MITNNPITIIVCSFSVLEEDNRVELSPFAEWNNFPSCLVPGTSIFHDWCNLQESNLGRQTLQACALPTELRLHNKTG